MCPYCIPGIFPPNFPFLFSIQSPKYRPSILDEINRGLSLVASQEYPKSKNFGYFMSNSLLAHIRPFSQELLTRIQEVANRHGYCGFESRTARHES
jgi:hypothetical protein